MAGVGIKRVSNDYTLGRGKLLIREDGSDDWTDFAHVLNFSTTVTPEKLEHFNMSTKLKYRDKTVITQVVFAGSCVVDVPILKNIKRFFMATTETTEAQTSGSWVAESITAPTVIGSWIKLPKKAVDPDVAVTVTTDPAGTTYVEGTDYEIDYENGLFRSIPSGAISSAEALLITGDFLAFTHTFLCAGEVAQQLVHIWFIGDPATGVRHDVRGFCLLTPTGELTFIGDDWLQFTLEIDFQDHPDYGGPLEIVDKGVA